jgi:hypothetical protein
MNGRGRSERPRRVITNILIRSRFKPSCIRTLLTLSNIERLCYRDQNTLHPPRIDAQQTLTAASCRNRWEALAPARAEDTPAMVIDRQAFSKSGTTEMHTYHAAAGYGSEFENSADCRVRNSPQHAQGTFSDNM